MTVALAMVLLRGTIPTRAATWGLVLLMAVDLWTVERLYWLFSPPAKVIYARDAVINTLKAEPEPVRVLGLDPVRVLALGLQPLSRPDAFLGLDGLMIYRIRNVLGYHGNQLGRYNVLVGENADLRQVFLPNVLQLTNTKYLLTNLAALPLQNFALVKGPVVNASGDTVYLYRLTSDNPYSWLTPIAVKAPDDQVLATILNPRFDVKRAALFDTSAKVRATTGCNRYRRP